MLPDLVLDLVLQVGVWKGPLEMIARAISESVKVGLGYLPVVAGHGAYWPLGEQIEHGLCVQIHCEIF